MTWVSSFREDSIDASSFGSSTGTILIVVGIDILRCLMPPPCVANLA